MSGDFQSGAISLAASRSVSLESRLTEAILKTTDDFKGIMADSRRTDSQLALNAVGRSFVRATSTLTEQSLKEAPNTAKTLYS
jgi:hypothetical protein